MNGRALFDLALGATAVGGWFLVYGLARLVTRPTSPPPVPATPELGPEPPAVVNLLLNRWSVNEDAAESTLLDLAARRFVELRQPGDDPMQTTLHLPATPPDDGGLRRYERRVLDRIRGLAVNGVVPLTDLTFRDETQAKAWNKRLRAEVIADARAGGLSRRRFGPTVTSLLVAAAAVAAVGVGLAALHYELGSNGDDGPGVGAGFVTFAALSALAGVSPGERDTPLGRLVAARWLGVRDWLRGHEQFAELPPAAVAVWDRYLGYGAAVGTTHVASAVLDFGIGDRKLVWSSFGGTWHRVRVRYPHFWPRYGRTPAILLLRAAIGIVVGAFLLKVTGGSFDVVPAPDDRGVRTLDIVASAVFAVALLAFVWGVYTAVRSLADLTTERTITGEVLWLQGWRSTAEREDRPSRPLLHHLAVDDGIDDRTTAWALPSEWADRCRDGDTVTIRVRPWSRRVIDLSVVGQGRSRELVEPVGTDDDTGSLAAALLGEDPTPVTTTAPGVHPAGLFTAKEVGQALGQPVRAAEAVAAPGPLAGVEFLSADRGNAVLKIQTVSGAPGRWVWRAHTGGQEPLDIGGGAYAYTSDDRAMLRVDDTTVVVTLLGDARGRHAYLPWLLTQGAARIATRQGSAPS